jgi:hypothetical protein
MVAVADWKTVEAASVTATAHRRPYRAVLDGDWPVTVAAERS